MTVSKLLSSFTQVVTNVCSSFLSACHQVFGLLYRIQVGYLRDGIKIYSSVFKKDRVAEKISVE